MTLVSQGVLLNLRSKSIPMHHTKRGLFAAVLLLICIGNFTRSHGADGVCAVVFLQIFAMGALSAVIIREVLSRFKNKDQ